MLATQTLNQQRPRTMLLEFSGDSAARVDREGHDPRRDRPGRRRRRCRLRRRVRRRGDSRSLDGTADDDLQHDDRVGSTRRPDRTRRNDVRLSRGPSVRTAGRSVAPGRRRLALARVGPGRDVRHPRRRRRHRARATGDLGDESRHGRSRHGHGSRPELVRRPRRPDRRRAGTRVHGAPSRPADRGDPDRSSVHRLVHELAHRRPPRRGGDRSRAHRRSTSDRARRARLGPGPTPGAGGRASTRSSWTPASSGASQAARCASG